MVIKATIKQDKVYIDNSLSFKIEFSNIWLGKEKVRLLDAFGNVLLSYIIRHRYFSTTKLDVIENNIDSRFQLCYIKKDVFWTLQNSKYYVRKKTFSIQRDFFRNEELIGIIDKNPFLISYLDEINFSFTTDNIQEVELCLLLFVIHSTLFNNDE